MSNSLVIEHGTILTLDDADTAYFEGTLTVEGNRIGYIGPSSDAPARPDNATVIDARGMLVLPGLIDLHYHTALGKCWSEHLPLWEYLETC